MNPKSLIAGDYFVFYTNNDMSSILNENELHIENPLELYAESDNNGLVSEIFPLQPSVAEDNSKRKQNKRQNSGGDASRSGSHSDGFGSHKISASNSF